MIPMFKVAMDSSVDEELLKILHSGFIGQGIKVEEFEKCLKRKFNNENVITVSAGTHGLSLALRLANIHGIGHSVISSPLTCTATNMPILQQGANIIWADVKDDFNIDPESIREAIKNNNGKGSDVKAVMVIHWGGYPCDMADIHEIAQEYNIKVIEDCAHAYGSKYKGTDIGSCIYSDYAMFSFQAIKHLTCGDGGALCCKEEEDYKRGKLLRWYGIDRESPRKDMRCEDDILEWGYKYHMNDLSATIGMNNMSLAHDNIKKARENANYYESELCDFDGIKLTQLADDRRSSYWLFTMMVDDRTSFAHMMGSKGIAVSRVHERNDKHTCFRPYISNLPNLERVIKKMICIPVGFWVTPEDREYIVDCIKEGW